MKNSQILCALISLLITTSTIQGQNLYDIKVPEDLSTKKCTKCIEAIKSRAKEIEFGFQRKGDDLYFVCSSKEWFNQIIKKNSDGIAVDIVIKDRYSCTSEKKREQPNIRGELLRPIYRKELNLNTIASDMAEVTIKIGAIPEKYTDKEVEFNLVLINNKHLCYYNNFFNLERYRWELLDMGMYLDTITYSNNFNRYASPREQYLLQHKTLKFEIPFEKNKAEYEQKDIMPLYDSLRLTNYTISNIKIKAYSSVEGKTKRNQELQQLRAKSITEALQEFQKPTIKTQIDVSENWVEFLNDISLTNYSGLSELSKDEIKDRLNNKEVREHLEPYLKNHRKAIILLELERRDEFKLQAIDVLINMFDTSIVRNNIKTAIRIQNSIFERIRNNELPSSYINKLEIPRQAEFGTLLNKNIVANYLYNSTDIYSTFLELTQLEDILPKDGHIKYNICALKFKIWQLGEQAIDPMKFKKEISALKKYGIAGSLIKRMLVNHNILMGEYYMAHGEYSNKDRALRYIYSSYKYLPLTNSDYLSLAQYFSSYAKYDWAIKLLKSKVKTIDVDEDLLFYYLNLTIIDDKMTRRSDYRTIMLNAINANQSRFCKLFNPISEGGITFQLLENVYLKNTYCENCERQ